MNPFLLLISLLPAALLLLRVYQLDTIEKEPPKLLLKMVGGGALGGAAAALAETLLLRVLSAYMDAHGLGYLLLSNFAAVALVEEFCKRLPVRLIAWRDSAFDYRFDAVVYCVFSALGFAALENVLVVARLGLGAALSRAVLSVPGHFFFAVYMGVYLGEAKAAEREGELFLLDRHLAASLLVPTLLHGFWDFALFSGSETMTVIFYVFVLLFFLLASLRLREAAEQDTKL